MAGSDGEFTTGTGLNDAGIAYVLLRKMIGNDSMVNEYKVLARIGFLFVMMYVIGAGFAGGINTWKEASAIAYESRSWGLGFGENGEKPAGDTPSETLKAYDAYYVGDTEEKVIYLTFDAGFENGNTPAILDALKKHNVSATFFIVGNYLEKEPELVKRMVEEGHTVGNHSYHHPDMTVKNDVEFEKEIRLLEEKFQELMGREISKYYRPPQGKYNVNNLKKAKEMGYQTFFWSLAYVDWLENKQPTKEEAFDKLLNRIHPGAIVLLHSTSATNGEILDELIEKWKNMGYEIRPLEEIKTAS